jgi:hypothetical protein
MTDDDMSIAKKKEQGLALLKRCVDPIFPECVGSIVAWTG